MKLFINGRKNVFEQISNTISINDEVIWIHCASLGEFEQGRPVIEKLKENEPLKKIVVTFFSPSGFEVRKNYKVADLVCYLPLDRIKYVKKFLKLVHPSLAIFVKYEFWPNYLKVLKKRQIATILISGIFNKNQIFFKKYGFWMKNILQSFNHFFVQDENSKALLQKINYKNVTVSGDTRFDRVYEITQQNNRLPFLETFCNSQKILVAGSTWKDDENLIVEYINKQSKSDEKFMIAPHNIIEEDVNELVKRINKPIAKYSTMNVNELTEKQVLVIDTIGILTKIYSYAQIAYVGGGFTKTGVHNVLEPATFGVPIIIGPEFSKFKEVKDLVKLEACLSIKNYKNLFVHLTSLFSNEKKRKQKGNTAKKYVINQVGASTKILNYLRNEGKIK
ncbi:MAG: 3-deoxy-D-manno-octulosonic acid transferase [Lutibacter sp.]